MINFPDLRPFARVSPTPCKITQKFYWVKVSSFHKFSLSQLLLILFYNISFVNAWPPCLFFRLCTVRPSLCKISMSKICLSFQNIETIKCDVFITVIVMRYRPLLFHKPNFFFERQYWLFGISYKYLSKLGVFSQ